jgi:membrane-bound lytic murein transglycosylase A
MGEPLTDDSSRESLLISLERSLVYLGQGKPGKSDPGPGRDKFSPENIFRTLLLFRDLLGSASDEAEVDRKIRENFHFWELNQEDPSNRILLTGYFEPILEGNLEAGAEYRYPLYGRPPELLELAPDKGAAGNPTLRRVVRIENGGEVPYFSRRNIDTERVLQGKGLELIWLKDP